MRYAYKVWHSEEDKSLAKRQAGTELDADTAAVTHETLKALVAIYYQLEPLVRPSVMVLSPSSRGAIVVLDAAITEYEADRSIARCLKKINSLDVDICLVAEALPSLQRAEIDCVV